MLFEKRERWTLIWPAKLLCVALIAAGSLFAARNLCAFLAVNSPVGGQFLVVEGWMPSYAYREAAEIFLNGKYSKVLATSVLREDGEIDDDTREDSGKYRLITLGVPKESVAEASSPVTHRDRTFHGAVAVKQWLQDHGVHATSVDLVTVGPHARRSRLLYEDALGNTIKVGIISVTNRKFDPDHWWRTSEGVRTVVDEFVAYVYARLIFTPPG